MNFKTLYEQFVSGTKERTIITVNDRNTVHKVHIRKKKRT
jgi:hypothetical protein